VKGKKEKPITDYNMEESAIQPDDVFIYQRVLGHCEIVDGHHWVERNVCWICSRWKYALFIFSDILSGTHYKQAKLQSLKPLEPKIRERNPKGGDLFDYKGKRPRFMASLHGYRY